MTLELLFRRKSLIILAAINILGTLFGFYYYLEQLQASSVYLWIFIPASPIATLLLAASIYRNSQGKNSGLLDALAFIGNFKYGLWTVFVLLYYSEIFFAGQAALYLFMFFSHLGMAVQAFIVYYWENIGLRELAIAGAWFLLNDVADYTLGTHTYLYTDNVLAAELAAYTLTFSGLVTGYVMIEKAPSIISRYGSRKI